MKTRILALLMLFVVLAGISAWAQKPKDEFLRSFTDNNLSGFKNSKGDVVVQPQFDAVPNELRHSLNPISKAGKFGYIDQHGHSIIDFQWDYAYDFGQHNEPNLAMVNKGDQTWRDRGARNLNGLDSGLVGMIDRKGKVVIPVEYTFIGWFNDGVAPVSKSANIGKFTDSSKSLPKHDGLFGFINTRNKTMAKPKYDYVMMDSPRGYFVVGLNFKYGAIDNKTGKLVVPLEYTLKEAIAKSTELSDKKYE